MLNMLGRERKILPNDILTIGSQLSTWRAVNAGKKLKTGGACVCLFIANQAAV